MNSINFDDVLNECKNGYEKYNIMVNALESLLDSASMILSEEDYQQFKLFLKDRILEDL